MSPRKMGKLYRSSRGSIFGICQGLADWADLPVHFVRLFTIIAFFATGFFPVGLIYFAAAFLLPKEPTSFHKEDDFSSKGSRFDSVKGDFEDLKERVKNMEGRVFDKERDWDERFRKE